MEIIRTEAQQEKWNRAQQLREDIEAGRLTDPAQLDPRETAIEFVQEAKGILRRKKLGIVVTRECHDSQGVQE